VVGVLLARSDAVQKEAFVSVLSRHARDSVLDVNAPLCKSGKLTSFVFQKYQSASLHEGFPLVLFQCFWTGEDEKGCGWWIACEKRYGWICD